MHRLLPVVFFSLLSLSRAFDGFNTLPSVRFHAPAINSKSNLHVIMVEGHSVHRIASRFRSQLVGKSFAATSPNGRFSAGALEINGANLSRMEAVGKNLFAFFTPSNAPDDIVVHVHFGMSGAWSVFNQTHEPEVKPTTRLRLEEIVSCSANNDTRIVTHLSAMTVQHGDLSLYNSKKATLGEDPLRPDADPDALWAKVSKSKKSIGQLIMDQSYFAGPGNIYRAEILFLAGIYPMTPGISLDREAFDKVWSWSVKSLRRGYDTGSILTVCPDSDPQIAARGERRYIYNKSSCCRCGGKIRSWDMSGRTCYACEGTCQPKSLPAVSTPVKMANSNMVTPTTKENDGHVPFISHCAPDSYKKRLDEIGAQALTIAEIRRFIEEEVGPEGLPPKSARKAVHVEALTAVLSKRSAGKEEALPPPIVSAEDAAREKAAAGENRAVEHIAELSREQAIAAVSVVTPSLISVKADRKKRAASSSKTPTKSKAVRSSSRRKLNYD